MTTPKTPGRKTSAPSARSTTKVFAALGAVLQERGPVSPELRQHMIRDAAYYRAERRGFREGDPLRDWLEAEVEIDRLLDGEH